MQSVAQARRTQAAAAPQGAPPTAEWTQLATDGELLGVFYRDGDQLAFARLVERHGAMVAAVCQRVLRNQHDADDACQATFLLLARYGCKVRGSESLAGWLYRVAYRTALAARRRRLRRREEPMAVEPKQQPEEAFPDLVGQHAVRALMEELDALPEHYRTPLVMRHLEGQSRRAIAQRTDATIASVQGRLARGAKLLRHRMLRRGVSLSAAVTTLSAASGHASAFTPFIPKLAAGHAGAVSPGAASLYHEGVRTMLIATLAKPLAVAAGALLLAVATVVPPAAGEAPAGRTEGLSLATANVLEAAEDAGVNLMLAESADASTLGASLIEGGSGSVESPVVEEPTERAAEQDGPNWRSEDARSAERLAQHERNLKAAFEAATQSIEELDGDLGFPSQRLEAKRKKLLGALESLRVMQVEAVASDEYIDAILAAGAPNTDQLGLQTTTAAPADVTKPTDAAVQAKMLELQRLQAEISAKQEALKQMRPVPTYSPNQGYFVAPSLPAQTQSSQFLTPTPPFPPQPLLPLGDASGEYAERNQAYGYSVEQLQERLNRLLNPSPRLDVDGDLGPLSSAAVKRFQKQSGLPETGFPDQATRAALGLFEDWNAAAYAPPTTLPTPVYAPPATPTGTPQPTAPNAWNSPSGATKTGW